jgi:hypothetical protein
MRTKKLLLTAAALLAVGIVSSQAQSPVYSQNVVGYASVVAPGSQYTMMTVPFVIGVSNGADEVFGLAANPSALPPGSTILIYSTAATNIPMSNVGQTLGVNGTLPVPAGSYITYYYDPEYVGLGYGAWWSDVSDDNNLPTPCLPVGEGFFVFPNGTLTTTFAGTVAVNTGGSISTTMPGSQYSMVGSVIPYAGNITVPGAGALTNNLPPGSTVLVYSTGATNIPLTNVGQTLGVNGTLPVPAGSYVTYYYDPEYLSLGYGDWWSDVSDDNNMPEPSLSVGQGIFIFPNSSFNWHQTLQNQ